MGAFLQFTDRATVTGFRKTADGYLAGNVLCARTGCQQYLAREVGLMGDGVVTVYRPEDVVFDLSLIHISEPTRPCGTSRMPSSA